MEVQRLVEEQAALRRVATLVARGVEPAETFSAVSDEVAQLFAASGLVLRFEEDGTGIVSVGVSAGNDIPAGAHWNFEEGMASLEVYRTGRSARVDAFDWSSASGPAAETAERVGIVSSVSNPILVQSRLWGAITVFSTSERLPDETEDRLERFSQLVATAIANAESREAVSRTRHALERVAAEQAALRRVATLVAQGVAPAEVFSAVTQEVARVFSSVEAPLVATVIRFDPGPECVLVGASRAYEREPVGSRWEPKDLYVSTRVLRTGRSARVDEAELETAGGPDADVLRLRRFFYQVGSPVVVEGRLWGAMTLNSSEALPPETDESLENFTELIATAIANTESGSARARLAGEQAALRRVATLVAQDSAPSEIFAAVSQEVDQLFRLAPDTSDLAGVVRFDPGADLVVVGVSKTLDAVPLGSHWEPHELFAPTRVLRTGCPARVDESDLLSVGGPVAEFLLSERYLTQVAGPIVVEGQLWGAVSVNSRESLPPDTEERLEKFTQLIATAISNAEARDSLRRLADEQAALRRVATLVAEGTAPTDLFAAVAVEVAAVVGVSSGSVSRFLPDGSSVVLASHNDPGFPVGSRWRRDEGTMNAAILETARPVRVDQKALSGPVAEASRISDVRSAVGAPIVVEGSVWGMVAVGRQHSDEPLPPQTETRLAAFTELIATAIANAESRDELTLLADEQAALRRVATLVAEGAPPDALFRAVADEVASVVGPPTVILTHHHADGSFTVVAGTNDPGVPVGSRWPLDGPSLAAMIQETGRAARIDDYSNLGGAVAAAMHDSSIRAAAGSPIVVDGKVWGHISVAAKGAEPLPAGTEQRLLDFTELISTAISNAESRDALARLAEEQAALRRVATLVARDAPSTDVFEAVAMEVGKLLDTDITIVGRYDGDGAATAIGNWSASPGGVPVGTRSVLGGRNVLTIVAETGKPARLDEYDDASGEAAEIARRHGWRSSIAAPIAVEGRLWGVMLVATQRSEPFPADAEQRLAAFTDLIATAIGNAEAHDEVRRFGNEQAALGRVATLVAAGAAPEQVFATVVEEVSSLLGLERIELVRYDGDATGTVIASSGDHPFPAGSTWSLDDPSVMATVARTGRAARIDDYSALTGEIARAARDAGFQSTVGAPITVEGHRWGVIIAISTQPEPIPERSEIRLAHFTELVGTAIANAESRAEVERLAKEQAALRRVATLVARGAEPKEVFSAVGNEISRLFAADLASVDRFLPDGPAKVLVSMVPEIEELQVGTRWELDDSMAATQVYRTGRSARIERTDWTNVDSPNADIGNRLALTSTVASPIVVEGQLWGAITVSSAVEPLAPDAEARLEKFTELVATAIANAEGKSELAASRRRIVAASDDTRRRIERDLHDGTQQRLVSLGLAVRAAEAHLPPDCDDLRAELSDVAKGLAAAVEDLQEISRGIHPAILSRGGLGPALETLAHRSMIPVELDITTDLRFAEPIEVAAYFVASEALANAAKHSQATRIDMVLEQRDDSLVLSVRDDGVGGADAGADGGSGLVGLRDRVEALGGSISVDSPQGTGTRITATLPVAPESPSPV